MSKLDPKVMRGVAIGLAIVASIAGVAAFIVGYVRKGELNFFMIGMAVLMVVLVALILKNKKSETDQ